MQLKSLLRHVSTWAVSICQNNTINSVTTYQPWQLSPRYFIIRSMKRKATDLTTSPKTKRQKDPVPDYCDVEPRRDTREGIIWPASEKAIEVARDFLRKWYI